MDCSLYGLALTELSGFLELCNLLRSLGTYGCMKIGNVLVLGLVLCADYLVMGVTTTAVLAYISQGDLPLCGCNSVCTLYCHNGFAPVVASAVSGLIIETIGWVNFFYLSAILALPGLLLLAWIAPFNAEKTRLRVLEKINHTIGKRTQSPGFQNKA